LNILSKSSLIKLTTCRTELILLITTAIINSPVEFSVVCGKRGEKEQNDCFKNGTSLLKYPNSKHNAIPSKAVDIIPYPTGYKASEKEWAILMNHIKQTAIKLNINIRCGIDWQPFQDKPHIELVK